MSPAISVIKTFTSQRHTQTTCIQHLNVDQTIRQQQVGFSLGYKVARETEKVDAKVKVLGSVLYSM